MAASTASNTSKTLRPDAIEVQKADAREVEAGPLSPNSWRHGVAREVPSRKQTGSLDMDDYFVSPRASAMQSE